MPSSASFRQPLSPRRGRRLMGMAMALLVGLAGSAAIQRSIAGAGVQAAASSNVPAGLSALELFAQRSPGQRLAAELAKGKALAQIAIGNDVDPASSQPGPNERALGKIFSPEDVADDPALSGQDGLGRAAPASLPAALAAVTPGPAGFNGVGPLPGSLPGSALTPPGQGGLPPGGGSVVPEPATWFMMVIGLGLTGIVMRKRRRSEVLTCSD